MRAMILAAGRGTRLAPITDHTPKPMLPIRGRPLIEWQIMQLKEAGIEQIVINTYHLGEQIIDALGDGQRLGVSIEYSVEETLLDTGGGIKRALPLLGDDPFLVLNGDIWTDFNFTDLPTAPPQDCPAHLVLTPTPDWREQGDFASDGTRVTARGTDYVFCGIALATPSLVANQQGTAFSLREIYFDLIRANALSAQIFHGTWLDIGTLAQYESLQR